jgi:hypothetical protein
MNGSPRRSSGGLLPAALFLLAVSIGVAHAAKAQAPLPIEATMKNMLAAVQANSLHDFVAAGDMSFKTGMTVPMLDVVSKQMAPRLKQGYTTTYVGKLNQQGYTVYLWKLEFKDGKDDFLVTMAVRNGEVGGFWFR